MLALRVVLIRSLNTKAEGQACRAYLSVDSPRMLVQLARLCLESIRLLGSQVSDRPCSLITWVGGEKLYKNKKGNPQPQGLFDVFRRKVKAF